MRTWGCCSSTLLSSLQLLSVHCISASCASGLRFCPLLAFPGLPRFPLFCDVIVYVLWFCLSVYALCVSSCGFLPPICGSVYYPLSVLFFCQKSLICVPSGFLSCVCSFILLFILVLSLLRREGLLLLWRVHAHGAQFWLLELEEARNAGPQRGSLVLREQECRLLLCRVVVVAGLEAGVRLRRIALVAGEGTKSIILEEVYCV